MRATGTIQGYIDVGDTITAFHEVIYPFCSHGAQLDLLALRDRVGGDFNIVENRAWLVSQLRCTKCGRKGNMTILITPRQRAEYAGPIET